MDMKQIFDAFDPSQYQAEAKARWGHTDLYKESVKRTKSYGPEDWKRMQAEQSSIYADAFAALQANVSSDSAEAMDIAERHRLSIDRWFYPCTYAIHASLADNYEADLRFSENIDKFGAGLTPFLSAAMRANARRHGGSCSAPSKASPVRSTTWHSGAGLPAMPRPPPLRRASDREARTGCGARADALAGRSVPNDVRPAAS